MRKTLSVLAIIAALSSSALADAGSFATLTGGEIKTPLGDLVPYYVGDGNVTISAGSAIDIDGVYGKYSDSASVSYAEVQMTGGEVPAWVIGGYTYGVNAVATQNTVTVSGGTASSLSGGISRGGNAHQNTVDISGNASIVGSVFGGEGGEAGSAGDAIQNTVTMSGGEVKSDIYGGRAYGDGNAKGNTVTVSGGTIGKDVMGGVTYGASSNVSDNTVTISGGLIKGNVAGGSTGGTNATVSKNTVTISGGTIMGNVIGGNGKNGEASNNTVNLVGAGATLGELTGSSFTISQGVAGAIGGSGSGNTLNVYGKGITAGDEGYFNVYNFHLAPGTQNGDTMLTLTGTLGTNLANKTVNVKCSGATLLESGDKVNLIHHSGASTVFVDASTTTHVDIIKGVSASYSGTVAVSEDEKDLVLTIEGEAPTTNDEALKSMTETRTDVAALVNAAADFMATTGVQQAKLAAKVAALTSKDGVAPFVALGGSSMRYNTGSHVDADGFNGALGVAKAFDDITLGLAGEYGLSSYKSYVGSTSAKGDSKLYGGALLADWQDKQGWHAESALRLGRTSTDYSAMTALGHTHYTDHASYQGIMLGGGKEVKVSKKCDDTVDLYARYFYSHTNASNTTATSGEGMHFSSVNSHRTMVGARYNHELTDTAVLYAGAAWMHEFDGDAHSVIGGFASPVPSLEGDSGMVEIGTTFAPCSSENILLNINVQGWTGVQRGITGGAGMTIKF